jgi:hypothetical protein
MNLNYICSIVQFVRLISKIRILMDLLLKRRSNSIPSIQKKKNKCLRELFQPRTAKKKVWTRRRKKRGTGSGRSITRVEDAGHGESAGKDLKIKIQDMGRARVRIGKLK